MTLRAHGWNTIRRAVEKNIQLIRALEKGLTQNGFEVLPGGQLSVACARWEGTDELQTRIASEIVASGDAWFAMVRFDGRTWLRFNLLNLYTREDHIQFLIKRVTDRPTTHSVSFLRSCSQTAMPPFSISALLRPFRKARSGAPKTCMCSDPKNDQKKVMDMLT